MALFQGIVIIFLRYSFVCWVGLGYGYVSIVLWLKLRERAYMGFNWCVVVRVVALGCL